MRSVLKSMLSLSALIIFTKLLGFIKQMVIGAYYGASQSTDIYFLSSGFIGDIGFAIITSLGTAVIATYTISKSDKDINSGAKFTGDALTSCLLISGAITITVIAFSSYIAAFLAPSYDKNTLDTLTSNIQYFSFSLILLSASTVFKAVLESNKKFSQSQFQGIAQSLIIICGTLLFAKKYGVKVLNTTFYLIYFIELIFLFFCVRKIQTIKFGNPFKNPYIKKCFKLMIPLFAGYALIELNQTIDKILAVQLGEGIVSALSYGQVVTQLVTSSVKTVLGSVIFVEVANLVVDGKFEVAKRISVKWINVAWLILMPISIVAFIAAKDISQIVFGRGMFGAQAILSTAQVIKGYAISFCPFALHIILARVFYSFGDTKMPVIANSIGVVVNIVLSILLSRVMGIFGITLASSIGTAIVAIVESLYIKKHLKEFKFKEILIPILISILAAIPCILLVGYLQINLDINVFIRLCVVSLAGILIYALVVVGIVLAYKKGKIKI